jgi:hypothetical protein
MGKAKSTLAGNPIEAGLNENILNGFASLLIFRHSEPGFSFYFQTKQNSKQNICTIDMKIFCPS